MVTGSRAGMAAIDETTPQRTSGKAIIMERATNRSVAGKPAPHRLWNA
jgi:hypothetical protein